MQVSWQAAQTAHRTSHRLRLYQKSKKRKPRRTAAHCRGALPQPKKIKGIREGTFIATACVRSKERQRPKQSPPQLAWRTVRNPYWW